MSSDTKIHAQRVFETVCNLADSSDWSRQISTSTVTSGDGGLGTRAHLQMYDGMEMVQETTSVDASTRVISFDMHELPSPVAAMSTQWTVTQTASEQSEVTINADYELQRGA
jgi:ribosome-associated toxin RatA of RatAB toxin-antitoxin module